MGLRHLSCKELADAWGLKRTEAATFSWHPFEMKLKALAWRNLPKLLRIIGELHEEARQEHFTQMELPGMIEERTGRANRHKSITAGE